MRILAISSYGNRNITLNWIISLKRNNYIKFIVFCFDNQLKEFLSARGYANNTLMVPSEWVSFQVSPDPQDFRKGQFDLMMQSRVVIWYQLLMLEKIFLACDTDVVILSKHMYDHIRHFYLHSVAEVIFSQDTHPRNLHYNTGFFYATPTDFVKTIMRETILEIEKYPHGATSTDQLTLNRVVSERWRNDNRIGALDNYLYSGGNLFFFARLDQRINIRPFVAHANYILTSSWKIVRLKERRVWYLDEMGEEAKDCEPFY